MDPHVVIETRDRVQSIRIARPDKKNALTAAMYAALAEALAAAAADPAVRVVTLTGTGDSFTSGNDIGDFLQRGLGDSPAARFLLALAAFPKPVIAVVNGAAIGIGATLLLHCDAVHAADGASFQFPFVNLGLVPEAASSLLLPQVAGRLRASELLLWGDRFDAAAAQAIGLVTALHPADRLQDAAQARALALAAKPPGAVRLTKALLKGGAATVPERIAEELGHFARQLRAPEAKEALQAFLDKRPPDFSRFD